ncbi:hypothetical protein QJS66_04650 [Kocuria rhizophila]|nr:hypothetical protein QJS66_04650 [Kocuria rhizophila]
MTQGEDAGVCRALCHRQTSQLRPALRRAGEQLDRRRGGAESWNVAPPTPSVLLERLTEDGQLLPEIHAARWVWCPRRPRRSRGLAKCQRPLRDRDGEALVPRGDHHQRCAIAADGYFSQQPRLSRADGVAALHPQQLRDLVRRDLRVVAHPEGCGRRARPGQSHPAGRAGDLPGQWLLSCSILTREAPDPSSGNPHLAALAPCTTGCPMGVGEDFAREWIADEARTTPGALLERAVARPDRAWRSAPREHGRGLGAVRDAPGGARPALALSLRRWCRAPQHVRIPVVVPGSGRQAALPVASSGPERHARRGRSLLGLGRSASIR